MADVLSRARVAGRRVAKRTLVSAGGPLLHYFDRHTEAIKSHLDQAISGLYSKLAIDVETMSEISLGMQRLLEVNTGELREVVATLERGRGPLGAAISELRPGASVLQVRGTEDRGPASLGAVVASMGFRVTVVDGLDQAPPDGGFDCVVWEADTIDDPALDRLRKLLAADGQLVVSLVLDVVAGDAKPDLRMASIEDELPGWSVHDRSVVVRRPPGTWTTVEAGAVDIGSGPPEAAVGLVRATPS